MERKEKNWNYGDSKIEKKERKDNKEDGKF